MNLPVIKDVSGKPGLTVGGYYNFELDPLFSLEVDVLYSYFRVEAAGVDQTLHRLALPVLARLWLMPGISVGAGPFGLLNLNSDSTGANKADAGLVGSVSMKYPLGRLQTILDIRYQQGFVQTNSDRITGEFQALLGAGYFF